MKLSMAAENAIDILVALVRSGDGDRVQRAELCGHVGGLTEMQVDEAIKRLKAARMVDGQRGRCGGYRLAKHPKDIGLLDVLEAVEGKTMPQDERDTRATGVVKQVIGNAVTAKLSKVTLAVLAAA